MDSRPGSASDCVRAIFEAAGGESVSASSVVEKAGAKGVTAASARKALQLLHKAGVITKQGWGVYAIVAQPADSLAEAEAKPARAARPAAEDRAPLPPAESLAPALGTRCALPPDNPSQGTIAQALRAVLAADVAMPLNEIFLALPLGWSRAEALSGLKEAALEGWVNFNADGWQLTGDPPEARADDPLAVARIPNYTQHRLQELGGGVHEQLSDAVRLGRSPALVRALANANAELATALQLLGAND